MTESNQKGNGQGRAIGYYLWQMYDALNRFFGALHWWPASTPFEVIVGAILTQNTAWRNVEKAIDKLKEAEALSAEGLNNIDLDVLAELIKPSGYYNVKARRLKEFIRYLYGECDGNIEILFKGSVWQIRKNLLKIKGIGEETADSILLYAGNKPIFVVDAYTRRILERHNVIKGEPSYGMIQSLFMTSLPCSGALYNQYHALLVNTAKMFCRKKKLCEKCPLEFMPGYPDA